MIALGIAAWLLASATLALLVGRGVRIRDERDPRRIAPAPASEVEVPTSLAA